MSTVWIVYFFFTLYVCELTGTDYISFFNLRSYDRLNRTDALVEQEEKTGKTYAHLQRAEAEEIMSESIINAVDHKDDPNHHHHPHIHHHKHAGLATSGVDAGAARADLASEAKSADSLAKDAMLNEGKVSDEVWEGSENQEKDNFVQEELYIHDKVLIVDDRFAICGSANMNDRVCIRVLFEFSVHFLTSDP